MDFRFFGAKCFLRKFGGKNDLSEKELPGTSSVFLVLKEGNSPELPGT